MEIKGLLAEGVLRSFTISSSTKSSRALFDPLNQIVKRREERAGAEPCPSLVPTSPSAA